MKGTGFAALFAVSVATAPAIAGDFEGSIKMGLGQDETDVIDQVKIDVVEAIDIAKKRVDGRVIEAELESEEGYLVWEVEILDQNKQEHEIIIDPATGKVLLEKKD